MNAQEDRDDYLPFVELGKSLHMVIVSSPKYVYDTGKYLMLMEKERNGKTYVYSYLSYDIMDVVEEIGLLREENRRVYKYNEKTGKDIMLYDFSLKEGDTFTYEYGLDQPVNCKVLKQGWLTDGPKVVSSCTISADSLDIKYRWLRTWTIGRDNGTGGYDEVTTWVECIGGLENIFNSFASGGTKYRIDYVKRKDSRAGYQENNYLPFSFYNIFDMYGQIHGTNLPTDKADPSESDGHHQLIYELNGDRLHVYGKVLIRDGRNTYAYFREKPTEDPLVRKLFLGIQYIGTGELATSESLFDTDFSVPGFDPSMNYIVVDNKGEEHPVINKTPQNKYRPFIEEGKVWKVGDDSGNPVQWVEHLFFDGDTIIDGKSCKQMMRQRYVNPDNPDYAIISQYPSLSYVGAWYEEDKKVYFCNATNNQFKLMYDFSLGINDTLLIDNQSYVIGPKQSGGMKGFKGVYRDVFIGEDFYNITWLEGVGSIEGPTFNVYYGKEYHGGAFLMSCTVGDEVIYLNDEYEDGATPAEARKKRFDFTHTIKIRPKAPIKQETSDACINSSEREVSRPKVKAPSRSDEQLSLYGEYNNLQLGIHLEPLDEAYQVSIADESGKVVYEKAVNAGNIVGLSIDISAYAKGHYTVTVENSSEAFTGEFEAQTTGIEENVKIEKCKNVSIYNLQGQRLNSLQKGLNIVNGRKISVK